MVEGLKTGSMPIALANSITLSACRRLSCVLGMLSSLEVKVLRPT